MLVVLFCGYEKIGEGEGHVIERNVRVTIEDGDKGSLQNFRSEHF